MSSENYQEYKKRRYPSSTWNYFLTSTDRSSAKCKICSRIVKTNGASTSGLHAHLKVRHDIKVDSVRNRKNSENESTKAAHDAPLLIVMAQDNNGSYDSSVDKSPNNKNEQRYANATGLARRERGATRGRGVVCRARSNLTFEEFPRCQMSSSYIWNHFLRSADAQTAKCKICSKILKTSGASTSGLHTHLKSKHKINILKRTDERNSLARYMAKEEKISEIPISIVKQEAQTSYDELELETPSVYNEGNFTQDIVDESSYHIDNCKQNVNTHLKIISRMVAIDGLPLNSFCDSIDLCNLLTQSGYELPSSNIETISMILEQSDLVKIEIANELKQFKSLGMKFCLSFEQYITQNNKKYISINIYNEDSKFGYPKNLGLLKIKSGMDNDEIIKVISDRLQAFDINLNDDIISFTSSLSQLRLGICLGIDIQFCLAQAVQYGVLEVLYKEDSQICQNTEDSYDSDTEYNAIECKNAFSVDYAEILMEPQLIYKEIIEKVRKLVRYYKNSAARNEILQNNVRKKHDREIQLFLDCKKRWSSLCEMIGRFLKLKDCIHESLTYLEMDMFINDEELQILNEIHDSLVVIRATITALCKPNSNLLTADTALRFMIRKLDAQNNAISRHFATVIRKHIKRSRTITSSILQYLHHRHIYNEYTEDDAFTKPTSEEIVNKILTLLTRIKPSIEDNLNTFDNTSITTARRVLDPLESEDDDETSIEKQLENEINNKCHSEIPKRKIVPQELDLKKIIMGEVSIYESTGGTRGLYLTMAYNLLLSVIPATSEAEHFFYSRKDAHKKLSSHPEVLLNSLFLLRAYFKEQRRLEES